METQRGPTGVSTIRHIGRAGEGHLQGRREKLLLTQTQAQNPLPPARRKNIRIQKVVA